MTARRVDRALARRNAALAGKPAPDVELEAALAYQTTTNRIGAAIARELALPEKTVQDWGNVNSGDRGPHVTLLYTTQLALEMRPHPADRHHCFAALDFVERLLGRVAFELPNDDAPDSPAGRALKIAHALTQFAEFIAAVGGPMNKEQRVRAHQELGDIQTACVCLLSEGK